MAQLWLAIAKELLPMVWFFARESERLQYEIRHDDTGAGYELVISVNASDEEKTIERVDSAAELLQRSHDIWAFLLDGGWVPLEGQSLPHS